jgi:hypothetical protein
MKKFLLALFATVSMFATAQNASKVFESTEIVWYGLDFTKAKFVGAFDQIGGAGAVNGMEMKTKWIPGWNNLIISEPQNFDLKKTFRVDNIYNDLSSVNELNSKLDADKCMTYNEGKIDKSEIDAMIKKYKGEKKEGVGLVFIVQNFNKTTSFGDVYVTFFDIATKKVLLCELVAGKAIGIGMRNFWAGSIKSILKEIQKTEYANWKSRN